MYTLFTNRGTEKATETFLNNYKNEILDEVTELTVHVTVTDIKDTIEKKKEEILEDTGGHDFIYDIIATVLNEIDEHLVINEITEALNLEEDY